MSAPTHKRVALTTNQRNLYLYFLNQREKHKDNLCFVPPIFTQQTRISEYLTALERLEERGLIRVDRSGSPHYTGWVMLEP